MDRLTSYCCWRPQMIDYVAVRIRLPCPENIFLLQEDFNAPTIESIAFPCEVSRLGLLPYFITMMHWWSQVVYSYVMGGRRYAKSGPNDYGGFFLQHQRKIDDICDSLSNNMQWSEANWKLFSHMGHGAQFTSFHFLLQHAHAVMHQEFLPYSVPMRQFEQVDAPHHCEGDECTFCLDKRIEARCVVSSAAVIEIASTLFRSSDPAARRDLQSIFTAGALLTAVNVQLWIHFVSDRDAATRALAIEQVTLIEGIFESWTPQWPIARAWITTLNCLRRLYEAVYTLDGQTPRSTNVESTPPALSDGEAYERPYPRLTEGNGLPELFEQMSDKVRFILLASLEDANATERALSSAMNTEVGQFADHSSFLEDFAFSFPQSGSTDDMWSEAVWGSREVDGENHNAGVLGPW
jgi:hypothetical protein